MPFKTWSLEILALFGTLGTGGAMVGLLARFDDKAVFEWNNITLNAVISTLSAVMKAMLLFSAAECIGQWKWILLRGSKRSLIDFERVDLASRGPLGCFDLVRRNDTPFLLRLGLVTAILTVAVDPFSQQLLQLQQDIEYHRYIYNDQFNSYTYATSPRASYYGRGEAVNDGNNATSLGKGRFVYFRDSDLQGAQLDFSMEAAILSSFAPSKEAMKQQSPTTCPTGNCTWDMFSTLGVCHQCNDLTSELEKVQDFGDFFNMLWGDQAREHSRHRIAIENATAFVLPNGHFLANVDGCNRNTLSCHPNSPNYTAPDNQDSYGLTAYSTGNWNRTVSMQDVDTLVQSMSVIYVEGKKSGKWPIVPVKAKECAVYFCIKEIESEMKGNELIETATEAESSRRVYYDQGLYKPDGVPLSLEWEANITERERGFEDDLYLSYTDRDGERTISSVGRISSAAISEFIKQTTVATWENETEVLDRVRKRIPYIKEMFNGAVAGGTGKFKPNAMAGIWSDSFVDIEDKFESLARSMTTEIRSQQEPIMITYWKRWLRGVSACLGRRIRLSGTGSLSTE